MATYDELLTIATTSSVFLSRIKVAGQIAAGGIVASQSPTANKLAWAKAAFADPDAAARSLIWPVLYANKAATSSAITTATDATIQASVDSVVAVLAA